MIDMEKVIKGLRCIKGDTILCRECDYADVDGHGNYSCKINCATDAIAMLEKQNETIKEMQNAYGYLQKQFFEAQDNLLKEQKTGHWILLENCSNSGVYCSECHTKVFDNYPFKKKFSYFCPHCGTRMEGEIERR